MNKIARLDLDMRAWDGEAMDHKSDVHEWYKGGSVQGLKIAGESTLLMR